MNNLNNNKLLPVLTILLLIVNVITLTMLWTGRTTKNTDGVQTHAGPVFEFVTRELKLDEQQQARYKILRTEHQQVQRPLADSIRKAKEAFFELLKDTTVTSEQVGLLNKKALALQEQLELVNFKHFQQLRAICNPEQQQRFDGIIQTVLRRMAGPGPGMRPPFREGEGRPGQDMPPPPEQ